MTPVSHQITFLDPSHGEEIAVSVSAVYGDDGYRLRVDGRVMHLTVAEAAAVMAVLAAVNVRGVK